MTTLMPERVVPDTDRRIVEDLEFAIPCEVPNLRVQFPGEAPVCPGDPAKWVAWRANCCPESPRYRLLCDSCKNVYQNWEARRARILCVSCHKETGGFIAYTPLDGNA